MSGIHCHMCASTTSGYAFVYVTVQYYVEYSRTVLVKNRSIHFFSTSAELLRIYSFRIKYFFKNYIPCPKNNFILKNFEQECTVNITGIELIGENQISSFISNHITVWRRKWHLTPVFLPGEFHGQRILVAYDPWGYERVRQD